MKSFKRVGAMIVCKISMLVCRILKRQGSSLPGSLALKLDPSLLSYLASQLRGRIAVVCGTNGKTTTNNLLCQLLESDGCTVIANRLGSNMPSGICGAFAAAAKLSGKLTADYACIEADEAYMPIILPQLDPALCIVTNLFRDQIDRYGEIDQTIAHIRRAIDLCPGTALLLNGDDPLVTHLGYNLSGRKVYYTGIAEDLGAVPDETAEGRICRLCGHALHYDYHHYSQLGSYRCGNCGFRRPALDFRVDNVSAAEGLSFCMHDDRQTYPVKVDYRGFYNIYNIVSALGGAALMRGSMPNYAPILQAYRPQAGRMEQFFLGKPVILNLAKNPAGFNLAIRTALEDRRRIDLLIAVNDKPQDGRDVSWLWDVEFERLNQNSIASYTVSGERYDDLAVRLKYAGIPLERLYKETQLNSAATRAVSGKGEACYMFVNYSANVDMQKILKELEAEHAHGKH